MTALVNTNGGLRVVGNSLGTGSECCCVGCECSPAVTVTLTGFADKYASEPLCILRFSSSCGGSGAHGHITAPGGYPGEDDGPIAGIKLTDGGSGYARLGRVAPNLTLANKATKAADVTFGLTQDEDACGCGLWSIASISVNDGGSGYEDRAVLAVQISSGDTEVEAVQGYIRAIRLDPAPAIEVTASSGSGASFSVTTAQANTVTDYETWSIFGVSVTGQTSGYEDGQLLTFSGANVVEVTKADARIATVRVEPTVTASIETATGVDAEISVTLASNDDDPETWSISSHTIDSAGSGYQLADSVVISVDDGTEATPAVAEIESLGESGEILSVVFTDSGQFYKATDEIESINIIDGGEYFDDSRPLSEVVISTDNVTSLPLGGAYYREDKSAPPCVSDVFVTVEQFGPSNGSNAQLSAQVDDNPESPTFGEISSVSIDSPGDNYLAYMWLDTCMSRFEGRTFVLPITTPGSPNDQACVYENSCGGNCSDRERLEYSRSVGTPNAFSGTLAIEHELHGDVKGVATLTVAESLDGCHGITLKNPSNKQQAVISASNGDEEVDGFECTVLQHEIAATISAQFEWRGSSRSAPISPGSDPCNGGWRRDGSQGPGIPGERLCDDDGPYINIEYMFTGGGNDVPGGYVPCYFSTNKDGSEADVETGYYLWLLEIAGTLSRTTATCNGWQCSVGITVYRMPYLRVQETFIFRPVGDIPVDAEGYPSGLVYLRCDREVPETFLDTEGIGDPFLSNWPTNFPRSATITFGRDLQ